MPNNEQPAAAETAVSNALGHLDQSKLASIIADKFLTSEEQKAPTEEPEVKEEESEQDESDSPEVVSEDSEESQAEAEEEAAPEPEEKVEEEDHEEDSKDLPKGVKKRISKLAEKRKAAEAEAKAALEKVRQLEAELQSAKTGAKPEPRQVESALGSDRFANSLNSVEEVDRQIKEAIRVILATEQNPEGGVFKMDDGSEREISAEEVKIARMKAIELKDIYLPERKRYLEAEMAIEPEVTKEYPWWKKPETPEYAIANQFLKDFPEIKRRADWKYIAGLIVEGVAAKATRQKAAQKPMTPVVKKAPAVPRSSAPVAVDPKRSTADKAKLEFRRNPSSDNLAQLFKTIGI